MAKFYKQNARTAGDQHAEDSDEKVLRTGMDDGDKPIRYGVVDVGSRDTMFTDSDWKPGALPGGGKSPPRYQNRSYSTKPVKAISPDSKGQRGQFGKKSGDKYEE